MSKKLKNTKILITGGAGFIGSNLVEYFLQNNNEVVCFDNLSTGHRKNITGFFGNRNFQFVEGDIRNIDDCRNAVRDCEYVFHQAALGSVPRSIKDPVTTNSVNIDGFLNMLTVSRDEQVKRFIYAASSSTYGDSNGLPKVEEVTGRPLSPYAITKVVNEYFAKVYSELYGLETIGLRYFNVFGKRQDPNGAYAAVIPLWVKKLISHESPVINGDGSFSRDFTYIDNVIQANELSALVTKRQILDGISTYFSRKDADFTSQLSTRTMQPAVVYEVFNVAFGGNTTLKVLFETLRQNLAKFDPEIEKINAIHGPERTGDIPHSLASIDKAIAVLGYKPQYSAEQGFEMACRWYYENLR
jgi:UDP-N-acetylglucosamine 4-epimerase